MEYEPGPQDPETRSLIEELADLVSAFPLSRKETFHQWFDAQE